MVIQRPNRRLGSQLRRHLSCPFCRSDVRVIAFRDRTIRLACANGCGLRFSVGWRQVGELMLAVEPVKPASQPRTRPGSLELARMRLDGSVRHRHELAAPAAMRRHRPGRQRASQPRTRPGPRPHMRDGRRAILRPS
jgi:hypothetical protein